MVVDQRAHRRAHRDLVDARTRDVAADADELHAVEAALAPSLVPVGTLREDDRHRGERLDVVDQGGLLVEPVEPRERRLVPRLRALAFERLEERRLLAADVATRAHENRDVEAQARTDHVRAEDALVPAAVELVRQRLSLRLVLVADIDDARAPSRGRAGGGHAL